MSMLQNQLDKLQANVRRREDELRETKKQFQKLKVETMRGMVVSVDPQSGNGDTGLVSRSEGRKCKYLFLSNEQTELLSSMIIKSAETDRILKVFGIEMPDLVINLMQGYGSSQDEWQRKFMYRSAEELARIEHRLVQWMSDVLVPFAVSHHALVLMYNMTNDMIGTCFARACKMAEGTWNGAVPISIIGITDMAWLATGHNKDPLWQKIRNQPDCAIWKQDELFDRFRAQGGMDSILTEEDDGEANGDGDEPNDTTTNIAEHDAASGSVKPRAPKSRETAGRTPSKEQMFDLSKDRILAVLTKPHLNDPISVCAPTVPAMHQLTRSRNRVVRPSLQLNAPTTSSTRLGTWLALRRPRGTYA